MKKLEWGPDVIRSEEEYLARAQAFLKSEKKYEVFTHTSKAGFFYKYDQSLNEFAVVTPRGVIKTHYRPKRYIQDFFDAVKRHP